MKINANLKKFRRPNLRKNVQINLKNFTDKIKVKIQKTQKITKELSAQVVQANNLKLRLRIFLIKISHRHQVRVKEMKHHIFQAVKKAVNTMELHLIQHGQKSHQDQNLHKKQQRINSQFKKRLNLKLRSHKDQLKYKMIEPIFSSKIKKNQTVQKELIRKFHHKKGQKDCGLQ